MLFGSFGRRLRVILMLFVRMLLSVWTDLEHLADSLAVTPDRKETVGADDRLAKQGWIAGDQRDSLIPIETILIQVVFLERPRLWIEEIFKRHESDQFVDFIDTEGPFVQVPDIQDNSGVLKELPDPFALLIVTPYEKCGTFGWHCYTPILGE